MNPCASQLGLYLLEVAKDRGVYMISKNVFLHMDQLTDHKILCEKLIAFFRNEPGIIGSFISGSGAAGGMDFYSDLDLGFVCANNEAKEKIWSQRFDWKLPTWFHRMDADHVKPYFIIYLFEPHIHVDLCFYTMENLPSQLGGPCEVAFDHLDRLKSWSQEMGRSALTPADWSNIVHEEERFWTWVHYAWMHVGRGEYYDIAADFEFMRKIPHNWHARLKGSEKFITRRLEQTGELEFIESMRQCFPTPDRSSLKTALLSLIAVHNSQKVRVDQMIKPEWKTSQAARDKITQLVSAI
ncbi:MAG: hypothetical protein ACK5P5_03455 [Pseudobdellovibrionaceae bacterium]